MCWKEGTKPLRVIRNLVRNPLLILSHNNNVPTESQSSYNLVRAVEGRWVGLSDYVHHVMARAEWQRICILFTIVGVIILILSEFYRMFSDEAYELQVELAELRHKITESLLRSLHDSYGLM